MEVCTTMTNHNLKVVESCPLRCKLTIGKESKSCCCQDPNKVKPEGKQTDLALLVVEIDLKDASGTVSWIKGKTEDCANHDTSQFLHLVPGGLGSGES